MSAALAEIKATLEADMDAAREARCAVHRSAEGFAANVCPRCLRVRAHTMDDALFRALSAARAIGAQERRVADGAKDPAPAFSAD